MKMISALARVFVLSVSLAAAAVQADVLLDVSDQLVAGSPTQLGRLSRNGVPQDWAASEPFSGNFNAATTYHYKTYTVNVGFTRYVQVDLDTPGGASGVLFTSAYLTSYDSTNKATNWQGDAGSSGNFFGGTDPNYFNVLVPAGSTLVIVVNETTTNAGVNQPYRLIVEGYLDVNFTSTTPTTTSVASSVNPSFTGQSVTFTASVTGIAPTGTVQFQSDAVTIAGCNAVALVGGGNTRTAQCTTNTLAAGSHSIVANYSGDATNAVSSSTPLTQVVNNAGGGLGCAPNPAQELATVTCIVTLTGNNPTGYVKFLDGAATIPGCGGIALAGSGNTKTATCNTTTLSVGSHDISGVYAGDKLNPGGSTNVVTEVINPRPATSTALASSANPSLYPQAVTFTATVTGAGPTGTVLFKDGATTIAGCAAKPLSAAVAMCTAPTLSPGSHSITAFYSGDINNAPSTSPVLIQTVNCLGKGCPVN